MHLKSILSLLALTLPAAASAHAASALTPTFARGTRFGAMFSRTTDVRVSGFDEAVRRVSGTAVYAVTEVSAARPRLRIDYRYDGRPPGSGMVEFHDAGATSCFNGACTPNTDASGLTYNPRLWGTPPGALRVGQRWTVDIADPWELGPSGRQIVTVTAYDPLSRTVTLQREGAGRGAWLGQPGTLALARDGKTQALTYQPGRTRWYGVTTFRDGLVLSDELMSERSVLVELPNGKRVSGVERQYILLDATPVRRSMSG
ncbi:hypothetical protein ACQVBX_15145 [Dyella sp. KULCS107]|uniref:hypothetical protein n=1 Tax=Dyella sp. KULCS107 TaxID=3422216 RepID=UPI003D6F47DB